MKKFLFLIFLAVFSFAAKKEAIIIVNGMTCPLCTMAIKTSLKHTPGVISAKVILHNKTATVIYDDTKTTPKKLLKAIEIVGYSGKIKEIKEVKWKFYLFSITNRMMVAM